MFSINAWILFYILTFNAQGARGCHYDLYTNRMVCPATVSNTTPSRPVSLFTVDNHLRPRR